MQSTVPGPPGEQGLPGIDVCFLKINVHTAWLTYLLITVIIDLSFTIPAHSFTFSLSLSLSLRPAPSLSSYLLPQHNL